MTDHHCDGDIVQRDSQPKDGGADGVFSDTTTSTDITPHGANANAPPDGVHPSQHDPPTGGEWKEEGRG